MSPRAYFAGIDIGTSAVKAVLISQNGAFVAAASRETQLIMPQPGWVEQNPAEWLAASLACLNEVIERAGCLPREIAGIGVTGQMHSLVCLDNDGKVLRPAILWADRRSADQVKKLENRIGRENLVAWAGNPLAAGFMLASWEWMRENEPEIASATHTLMLPKDEVRFRLTGKMGTEPSDASSTLLFNVYRRDWSIPLMEIAGLHRGQLPPIHESAEVAGGLLPEMASACGLLPGTPAIYGASDQAAQALWQGVMDPGTISCTLGTGGQLLTPLAGPLADSELRLHLFCHALPDRWHLEAAMLTAGACLRWLRDRFAPDRSYQELADWASQSQGAETGLFFLPYLTGERTPWMDPLARAGFIGLTLEQDLGDMTRAVMEGVVFGLRQGLELVEAITGHLEPMIVSGGGTRHPFWLQLQADILNRSIQVSDQQEATACGAALLAAVGTGVYPDVRAAVQDRKPLERRRVDPDPKRAAFYEAAYHRFCTLYPALKPIFHAGPSSEPA